MGEFHGTTVAGFTTNMATNNAVVICVDGQGVKDEVYKPTKNMTVVKYFPAEYSNNCEKLFKIHDEGKIYFGLTGLEDDIIWLNNRLKSEFKKWKHSRSVYYYADHLREMMRRLESSDAEKPEALIGGFDKIGDLQHFPLLYNVSCDYVYPVHESLDRFACIGAGHDIARAVITPHFSAHHSRTVDETCRLAQRAIAQAGDDGCAGGIVTTVAFTEDQVLYEKKFDISVLRTTHRLGLVRRPWA